MLKVNLFDSLFSHTKDLVGVITSTYLYPPKNIEWVEKQMVFDGITVFTDSHILEPIVDQVETKIKVAWLIEPPEIHHWTYDNIIQIEDKFDYILTFHPDLLKRGPKYKKYVMGQSRVPDDIANFYEKSKKISLISSGKAISSGHRYRGQISNALAEKHNIDLWGYAHKPFAEKKDALIDYQFNIAIMNSRLDNYFTEILVDCFRLGTVPIFWGCPNIGDYFDLRGMETFETVEELDDILTNLKPYSYYKYGIQDNFQLAKEYLNTDDYIAKILVDLA